MLWLWLVAIVTAYLVGSIPFGLIIGRMKGIDIRQHGSRNIGATNVTRVLGKRFGVACFILDLLKGAAPVLASGLMFGTFGLDVVAHEHGDAILSTSNVALWLAAAAATILGHMFSIFLRFRGGKGVATSFGAMLGMWNLLTFPAVLALVVWYTTLRLTKYVSLASILAAASLPVWCMIYFIPPRVEHQPFNQSLDEWLRAWPLFAVTAGLAAIVVWKHRANLARIRRGVEPKVRGGKRQGDLLAPNAPAQDRPSAISGPQNRDSK